MSHFYGEVQSESSKSAASRQGSKTSGLTAHIRGWENGILVEALHHDETDEDWFYVYKTGGSNNPNDMALAGVLKGNIWEAADA